MEWSHYSGPESDWAFFPIEHASCYTWSLYHSFSLFYVCKRIASLQCSAPIEMKTPHAFAAKDPDPGKQRTNALMPRRPSVGQEMEIRDTKGNIREHAKSFPTFKTQIVDNGAKSWGVVQTTAN
jgi:hypothetical protein